MLFNRNEEEPIVEIEELGKNKDSFSYKVVREKERELIYRLIHEDLASAKMLHIVIYNNSVYSSGS